MYEIFSAAERERLFRIDHDLGEQSSEAYYLRKVRGLQSGRPTWMVRNFDTDSQAYGLWHKGLEVAVVDDEGDGFFRAYVRDRNDGDTFLDDTQSLIAAIDAVERYWGLTTG